MVFRSHFVYDPEGAIRRLDGSIDEVEVFNRALSASEIQDVLMPVVKVNASLSFVTLRINLWKSRETTVDGCQFIDGDGIIFW